MMRMVPLFAAALLIAGGAFAQTNAVPGATAPPAVHSPESLPEDRHDGLTVSADAYSDSGRAKQKFGKANPVPVGILPVEVFLHNETLQPIRVDMSTVQLNVQLRNGRHQDVDWLAPEEVAAQVAHPEGPSAPQQKRLPMGIPLSNDKKADQMAEILQPLALDADIVPPMGTIHGFLFFDLNRDMSLAEGANLYVPDVTTVPAKKQLMFFEVPLGKR